MGNEAMPWPNTCMQISDYRKFAMTTNRNVENVYSGKLIDLAPYHSGAKDDVGRRKG